MQSDTKLFHNAFKAAGFRPHPFAEPITVLVNKHKSGPTQRIKLVDGNGVFLAPQFVQEALEQSFKNVYGDRYLGGEFIARKSRSILDAVPGGRKSFVIYLLNA